jgi:hypothetical protein
MVPSSFFMNSGVNVDPTLKLVSVGKFLLLLGMILTKELRK